MNETMPEIIEIGGEEFIISPANQAMVIIDWPNLSMALRRLENEGIVKSHYITFSSLFRKIIPKGCRVVAKYLVARKGYGNSKAFLDRLKEYGLEVICPWEYLPQGDRSDDEIIIQLIQRSVCEDGVNTVILVSGDGHFINVLEQLIWERNIRVIVAGFPRSTNTSYMSKEHFQFINLTDCVRESVCDLGRRIRMRKTTKKPRNRRRKSSLSYGKVRRR